MGYTLSDDFHFPQVKMKKGPPERSFVCIVRSRQLQSERDRLETVKVRVGTEWSRLPWYILPSVRQGTLRQGPTNEPRSAGNRPQLSLCPSCLDWLSMTSQRLQLSDHLGLPFWVNLRLIRERVEGPSVVLFGRFVVCRCGVTGETARLSGLMQRFTRASGCQPRPHSRSCNT